MNTSILPEDTTSSSNSLTISVMRGVNRSIVRGVKACETNDAIACVVEDLY